MRGTVDADKRAAAALWIEASRSKLPLDVVGGIGPDAQVPWTLTPDGTMPRRADLHGSRVGKR